MVSSVYPTVRSLRPDEATFMYKFSCFKDFHVLLRNAIIWPIRCSILTDQGVMNGSLRGLSDEIKLKIIRYLTVREILILGQTCHDLNRICNDQVSYRYRYRDTTNMFVFLRHRFLTFSLVLPDTSTGSHLL